MSDHKNFALLVVSCDRFAEWWSIFFQRKEKFWANCKYETYLISNQLSYHRNHVINIRTGIDKDWSSNLILALQNVKQKYVLLLLEDAPFNDFVDEDSIELLLSEIEKNDIKYLNLKTSPKPPNITGSIYSIYPPKLPYRAALVPCIWEIETLKSLLVAGENAWQFEIRGSKRSYFINKFYATNKPIFNLLHCVIKGKIDLRAYWELKKTNELSTINSFVPMTKLEFSRVLLGEYRGKIFNFLPYQIRNSLRDLIYGVFLNKKDWI